MGSAEMGGRMSESESYPWRRAGRFTLGAFVVLTFLPVWPAWYFSSWEANGKLASFWKMLDTLPRALERNSPSTLICDFYGPSLIAPAVLLGVCLLLRRWLPDWIGGLVQTKPNRVTRHLALCLFLFLLATVLVVTIGR